MVLNFIPMPLLSESTDNMKYSNEIYIFRALLHADYKSDQNARYLAFSVIPRDQERLLGVTVHNLFLTKNNVSFVRDCLA